MACAAQYANCSPNTHSWGAICENKSGPCGVCENVQLPESVLQRQGHALGPCPAGWNVDLLTEPRGALESRVHTQWRNPRSQGSWHWNPQTNSGPPMCRLHEREVKLAHCLNYCLHKWPRYPLPSLHTCYFTEQLCCSSHGESISPQGAFLHDFL